MRNTGSVGKELTPGLMLVHGNRAEQLRDLVVSWLGHAPLAPLENECILVQSNGMAQWLRLALADDTEGQGVAAALDFPLPARFVWQAYRAVLGADRVPTESPLDKSSLCWRLMRLLPALLDKAGFEPLRDYLLADRGMHKLQQLAQTVADLYDQYQVYRADLLLDWAAGEDVLRDASGHKHALPASDLWQACLWRELMLDLAVHPGPEPRPHDLLAGRAAIHQAFLARVRNWSGAERPAGLPRRVIVFGISAMPRQHIEALCSLASWIQILICVPNPCEHFWSDIQAESERLRARFRRQLPRQSPIMAEDAGADSCQAPGDNATIDSAWPADGASLEAGTTGAVPLPAALAPAQAAPAGGTDAGSTIETPVQLSAHDSGQQVHPLLAAWGRQGRDFVRLLDDFDDPVYRQQCGQALAQIHQRLDLFEALPGDTLLEQLQDDIRDLRPLQESRARWPDVDPRHDKSIRFHCAHSPLREVEILHDQLLNAFEQDSTLSPRDIIVMVPRVEDYAAAIQAVFGLYGPNDRRHIPYSVVDGHLPQSGALSQALQYLLHLPTRKISVSELMQLLQAAAVRDRFGLSEDDLPWLRNWTQQANIRWGLHAQFRQAHAGQLMAGLAPDTSDAASANPPEENAASAHPLEDNASIQKNGWMHSWDFGLARMLLAYASGADAKAWEEIEPLAESAGQQAVILGSLARLLDRLDHHWKILAKPATPVQWRERLQKLLQDFFLPASETDILALQNFEQMLEQWLEACALAEFAGEIPASVVAAHCLAGMQDKDGFQRFLTGGVTFATLMPMRAIPFRHVCLLGMQDGAYPRAQTPADFDLLSRYPRPGDRSRRLEDRYLFLEAVLSARESLYVSWVGRSIQDNTPCPPGVLLAQLMEHLDRGWQLAGAAQGSRVSQALLCEHPLQPFSMKYFDGSNGHVSPLFTYAVEWRAPPGQKLGRSFSSEAGGGHVCSTQDRAKALSATTGGHGNGADDLAAALSATTGGPDNGADDRTAALSATKDPHVAGSIGQAQEMIEMAEQVASPVASDTVTPAAGTSAEFSLASLADFLRHPLRFYHRQCLQLSFPRQIDTLQDDEPFEFDALQKWHLRNRLVTAIQRQVREFGSQSSAPAEECRAALQAELACLLRDGSLAAGALGELQVQQLDDSMRSLIDEYAQYWERWPQSVAHVWRLCGDPADTGTWLDTDLRGLRADADGRHCLLLMQTSNLIDDKRQYRITQMLSAWVQHLAAHAFGYSLESVVLSPRGSVTLPVLDPDHALAQWKQLCQAWLLAGQQGLPVEACSANEWLRHGADPLPQAKSWQMARIAYETEVTRDPCLRRSYPDFAALCKDGQFYHWAQTLYGELWRLLRTERQPAAKGR